jgi:hypothetical protein
MGSSDMFTFGGNVTGRPVVGGRYCGEAWARSAPGAIVPTGGLAITVRTYDEPLFARVESHPGSKVAVADTWQLLSVELDVMTSAGYLDVYLGSDIQSGACFLVDDLAVYRVK